MRMCHIVICDLLRSTQFSALSYKRHDFREKLLNTKYMFWFSLQLLSENFFILRRNEWDMIKNVYLYSCKVPFILVGFLWNWDFLGRFFEKYLNVKFHENSSRGNRVVTRDRQTNGRTGITKLTVAFCNSANAPNVYFSYLFTLGTKFSVNLCSISISHFLHRITLF